MGVWSSLGAETERDYPCNEGMEESAVEDLEEKVEGEVVVPGIAIVVVVVALGRLWW